jgi:hypothetical protein
MTDPMSTSAAGTIGRTYEDAETSGNLQVCNCLTELYSANSKLAGAHAHPPWQTSRTF